MTRLTEEQLAPIRERVHRTRRFAPGRIDEDAVALLGHADALAAEVGRLKEERDSARRLVNNMEQATPYTVKRGILTNTDLPPGVRLLLINPEDGEHKDVEIRRLGVLSREDLQAEIDRLRAAAAGLVGACRSALARHRYPVDDGRGGARPMHCCCDTCCDLRAALDAHAADAVPTADSEGSDRP